METKLNPAYRIQTPRLILRCWQPSDASLLKKAVDDSREHLQPWMSWVGEEPEPLERTIQGLRSFRGKFDLDENYVYGIFDLPETRVLGGTGLHPRAGEGGIEIGYWIHANATRQGLATEVAAALTKVAFTIHQVDRVEIHCEPANQASAAVPRKLGFSYEGTLRRRSRFTQDDWRDSMVWTLFASDYPQSPAAELPIQAWDCAGMQIR
jgi:RimJ/RimL family protein N-acetyltransferase